MLQVCSGGIFGISCHVAMLMLCLGLGTKSTMSGLGKHQGLFKISVLVAHNHDWKCPEVSFKTPASVATNTTGDGPTSCEKHLVLFTINMT